MMEPEAIGKCYQVGPRTSAVLRNLSLRVDAGDIVAIMGSSGSGKSTLYILGIVDDHDGGRYTLDGPLNRGLRERSAAVYRNPFIGFVSQAFNLLPFKTAIENVELPQQYRGVSRGQRRLATLVTLERMGLSAQVEHVPEMSGGREAACGHRPGGRRSAPPRAGDAPTGARDTATSAQIMNVLEAVNRANVTVLLVAHEPDIDARAPRLARIRDGSVLEDSASAASWLTTSPLAGAR